MKRLLLIISMLFSISSHLLADSLSINDLQNVDRNLKVYGHFEVNNDSVFIFINIIVKNNLNTKFNPIALCLNEIKIFSPKRGIGEMMSWLNQNSPTSSLLILDTSITATSAYTHGEFFRHYRYLPLFLYIYDSTRIKINIHKSQLPVNIKNNRFVLMLQYAKLTMLEQYIIMNDLPFIDMNIHEFEDSKNLNQLYSINLTKGSDNYYSDISKQSKIKLTKNQSKMLSILFMNYCSGIIEYRE